MTRQILVALKGADQIEKFLPYIQQIVRPRMKVVFLVHDGLSQFRELTDQLSAVRRGLRPALLPGGGSTGGMNDRALSLHQQIFRLCEPLRNRGVEISVNVYCGSLRRAVRQYLKTENVHLVMLRRGFGGQMMIRLRKIGLLSRYIESPALPPVLLFHPGRSAERSP